MSKKVIYGLYDDDDVILQAVKDIRKKGVHINEVYSPFPIHGLDHALGLEPTRLAITSFIYGCTGLSLALLMMWYMMIHDWPMNIGGKPSFSLLENIPAFVPIFFEFTVLCAAHGMAITYLLRNKTLPGMPPRNPDPRTTDDMFVIEISASDNSKHTLKENAKMVKKTGVVEMEEKVIK